MGTTSDKVAAVAGSTYTGSGYFLRNTLIMRSAAVSIHFYNSSDVELSAPSVTTTEVVGENVWERKSTSRLAPAGTAKVSLKITTTTTNGALKYDAFLLEESATLGDYFDGSTVKAGFTYAWTGTPHASQSTEQAAAGGATFAAPYSGTGTLASTLHRKIASFLAGNGSLTSDLQQATSIDSVLSGSGVLTAVLGKLLSSKRSGSGLLQSVLIESSKASRFSGAGVLFTELLFSGKVQELGTGPLGKLVNYTVNSSAVPLNPSEGSGATPGVNAVYVKGVDPETALGTMATLQAGTIGSYSGEVDTLTVNRASSNVAVSVRTPLTLLNVDMLLFPTIQNTSSDWTAARAVDYWTQQCGLFYDDVPGECVAYTSLYGHGNAYGADTTKHFYERLVGGIPSVSVVNGRSVHSYGSDVTATTAFHEHADVVIPFAVPKNSKLVFSTGVRVQGTSRTSTVSWNLVDSRKQAHVLSIVTTSAGVITAKVGGVTIGSTTVVSGADYRIAASVAAVGTALVAKLSVHTDELDGSGALVYDGGFNVVDVSLPMSLKLKSIEHVSAGGSGSTMLRWGTYLTVSATHPSLVPEVRKSLLQSSTSRSFVSGFEGNVWNLLNEFCSIARLDVGYVGGKLTLTPRNSTLAAPEGNFSEFSYSAARKGKRKQVAVVNRQSEADTTDTAVLWRADSVFQVAAGEIFETTVQTPHSILRLVQPQPVQAIAPFPYTVGAGQYVVTGADGYIVSAEFWQDAGGKVEAYLTGVEGEIGIRITAPVGESVRAPYRISEGAGDRPALYVSGSGILNTPKEVHVGTGARNAKEGFDTVFESPFISGTTEAYDAAMAMALEYSAMTAEVDFELPNDFDTPTRFGQFPAGAIFTDNVRNYRISNVSQSHSKISGNAMTHTTVGAYVATLPAGATIADVNALNSGASVRQFNIKPLRGTSG